MNRNDFCHACFTGDYPIEVPKDVKVTSWRWKRRRSFRSAFRRSGVQASGRTRRIERIGPERLNA